MNKETAVVIIPTYNEAGSIGQIIDYLVTDTFPGIKNWNMKILVVDANSPDGTANIVRDRQKRYPEVDLLVEEKKEGLGAAYFKGFRQAVNKYGADAVIQFDGDFQHPPEAIPVMLAELERGSDLVMGSRRIRGGSYPKGWGFKRQFFSRVGGFVARFLLFFPERWFFRVTDPTTGLKANRVNDAFRSLDFDRFHTKGFGYSLEMLFKLTRQNVTIKEIPLHFQIREEGESKITEQTPGETLHTVLKLRLSDSKTRRFLRFAVVGFMGVLVNVLALELFNALPLSEKIAEWFRMLIKGSFLPILSNRSSWSAAFGSECAIVHNFLLNNLWTFSDRKVRKWGILKKFLQFNLTSLGAILIQYITVGTSTLLLGNSLLVRQVTLLLTIALLVVPYNWLMYNKIIWRKR